MHKLETVKRRTIHVIKRGEELALADRVSELSRCTRERSITLYHRLGLIIKNNKLFGAPGWLSR